MEEQENNEIKILIDALKYTSSIIIDLTNKLTIQEEKINILENKLNKTQKMTMENNLKIKTIDFDKLNLLIKSSNKIIEVVRKKHDCQNDIDSESDSDYDLNNLNEMEKYIIKKNNKTTNTNTNTNINTNTNTNTKTNVKTNNNELKNKDRIDKLIGSIVKRKNLLEQMMGENKSIIIDHNLAKNNVDIEHSGLDLTIKTGTIKTGTTKTIGTENTNSKVYNLNDINDVCEEEEQGKIVDAQNNDLDKANNILKQIRRRANFTRKM